MKSLWLIGAVTCCTLGYVAYLYRDSLTGTHYEASPSKPQSNVVVTTNRQEVVTVDHVIDGDTFVTHVNGVKEKVRLIGMNAPEVGECYGVEATNRLKELVLNKQVALVPEVSERDRYGRLLRDVYVDEMFVNEVMQVEGYSTVMTVKPDTQYAKSLKEVQADAQRDSRGLWQKCR